MDIISPTAYIQSTQHWFNWFQSRGKKNKYFAKLQEVYHKDVEHAFGVLQAQYAIIQYPGRLWQHLHLSFIMKKVIILHNMTIEDERGSNFENN